MPSNQPMNHRHHHHSNLDSTLTLSGLGLTHFARLPHQERRHASKTSSLLRELPLLELWAASYLKARALSALPSKMTLVLYITLNCKQLVHPWAAADTFVSTTLGSGGCRQRDLHHKYSNRMFVNMEQREKQEIRPIGPKNKHTCIHDIRRYLQLPCLQGHLSHL